jgi:hypothetical protein
MYYGAAVYDGLLSYPPKWSYTTLRLHLGFEWRLMRRSSRTR